MNFEKLCNVFVNNCFLEKLVFSEIDIIVFSKACGIEIDYNFLNSYVKNLRYPNYVSQKSILGPCIFRPNEIYTNNVKYDIKKIISELQLSRQNISIDAKIQKIVDYCKLVNMS